MKWMLLGPEITYLAATFFFLILSMGTTPNPKRDRAAALIAAVLGMIVCLAAANAEGWLFAKAYRVDLFSQVFKVMLSLGLFLIICICGNLDDMEERGRSDFFVLLFACTLALMLLAGSNHLLAVYVSLELSSYSLYIMVTLRKDRDMGLEAGIKYFLAGIFASAIMLFGLALVYATTRATYLNEMALVLPEIIDRPAVILGIVLTLSGFLFKLAVFPFHFWAPDVYQGAMSQVTAYIATASKVAGIAVLIRVVSVIAPGGDYLVFLLLVLSIMSMTIGNLAAIAQKDMKRMLGYSTIAHAGYVLIGILSLNPAGYAGAVFYAMALLLMKFTVFLVVVEAASDGRNLQIEQLAGLHQRSPILALALMVSLFSLAGIPPTIGFTGKFLVFIAAMEKGHLALVVIAMINVTISLYYYLLVIRAAYLLEPEGAMEDLTTSPSVKWLAGALIAAMLAGGFFPYPLLELSRAAARALM